MRADLARRVEALEGRYLAGAPGAWLRIAYHAGAPAAEIQKLEGAARAAYVAERGAEPRAGFGFVHRILVGPPGPKGGADAD